MSSTLNNIAIEKLQLPRTEAAVFAYWIQSPYIGNPS